MTVLGVRGATVLGTNGTTWATTANAVDGTFGVNNATYATWTSATSGATAYIEISNFDFSAVPSNATLNSVTVYARQYVNHATRIPTIQFSLWDGATQIGSTQTVTASTTANTASATFNPTYAQLQSANLKVRVYFARAAVTQSQIAYVDYADITADYTVPALTSTLTDDFSGTLSQWSLANNSVIETGQAKITYVSGGSGDIESNVPYDLDSMFASVIPVNSGAQQTGLQAYVDASNYVEVYLTGTTLSARVITAGTPSTAGSVTYNATDHKWWKIVRAASTVTFHHSPNGIDWTQFASATPGFALNRIYVKIFAANGNGAEYAYVDNFNVVPNFPVVKVWNGSTWVAPVVWNGTAWVSPKVWNGTDWARS
jgi:hypothetical protein